MDKFEQYIKDNRDAFEVSFDPEKNPLPAEVIKNKSTKRWPYLLILLLSLFVAWTLINEKQSNINSAPMAEISDMQLHYGKMVSDQLEAKVLKEKLSQEEIEQLENLMNKLDDHLETLIEDLESQVGQDKILEEIARNYHIRLQMLEEIIHEPKKVKNERIYM